MTPQDIIAHALIEKAQECLDPTNGDIGSARVLIEAASCVMVDPAGLTSTDRLQRIYDRGEELTQLHIEGGSDARVDILSAVAVDAARIAGRLRVVRECEIGRGVSVSSE